MQANSIQEEQDAMDELLQEYANAMAGEGSVGDTTNEIEEETPTVPEEPVIPTGPNGNPLTSTVTSTEHTGTTTEDTLGNPVYIPGGFKIADDSGSTVKDGIVIEDTSGNQFVWIPVSNINHDGSNKIKVDENTEVEITLGRYTFDTTTGAETIVQKGADYANTVTLDYYFQELTEFREADQSSYSSTKNATAKDLAGFIDSVSTNKGYYLARYEASYSSGSAFGVGNDETYYKPASKVSTANSTDSMNYTAGTLWHLITQGNASKTCRQMYYGNSYVESDLCNSYAWDTAIVYIQAMGNSNYANANRDTTGNTSLLNTGATGDEVCKIFDMAANLWEWTTEYSTRTLSINAYPCTFRGGVYLDSSYYTSLHLGVGAPNEGQGISFRPTLYVK